MYVARNVVNLPVWLVFICRVVYQKSYKNPCIFVKVIAKKSVAPFLCGHGVVSLFNLALPKVASTSPWLDKLWWCCLWAANTIHFFTIVVISHDMSSVCIANEVTDVLDLQRLLLHIVQIQRVCRLPINETRECVFLSSAKLLNGYLTIGCSKTIQIKTVL